MFNSENKCNYCCKECKTRNQRCYHKTICEMYSARSTDDSMAAAVTVKSAKKAAASFAKKVADLDGKLMVACQTAYGLKVSNDGIDGSLMELVCSDEFVKSNVHALRDLYRKRHDECYQVMKENADLLNANVEASVDCYYSGRFDDLAQKDLHQLKAYLNTLSNAVEFELMYGDRQEPPLCI